MLRPLPPPAAYRADLAQSAGATSLGCDDGRWLLAAELLARIARRDGASAALEVRARLAEAVGAAAWPDPQRDPVAADSALARDVGALAESMEEQGALQLAYSVLALCERAAPAAADRQHGMTLAQRARVARKLGDLEVADALYQDAARLGRAARDPAVIARATLGLGVVARVRGNYPVARTLFRKGLAIAERAGLVELQGMAHHGLLIAAGVAGDFDTALRHGWAAFRLAGDDAGRQAELLFNVAAASSDAGYDAAALQGYLAAAARLTAPRLRLPALAGAAVSAARLGDAERLAAITDDIGRELARDALPYERAQALALLAEAWAAVEPAGGGQPYRDRALALARAHAFHEIVHRTERLAPAATRVDRPSVPRPVSRPTRRVIAALEALAAGAADAPLPEG